MTASGMPRSLAPVLAPVFRLTGDTWGGDPCAAELKGGLGGTWGQDYGGANDQEPSRPSAVRVVDARVSGEVSQLWLINN